MITFSARTLFWMVFLVSFGGLIALCWSVLAAGDRAEAQVVATVEARLLASLEETGISGLVVDLDRIDRALVPGRDRIEVALWQVRPNFRELKQETEVGVAEAFETMAEMASFGGADFLLHRVDVAKVSADWTLPMADVDLRFGIASPSAEVQAARQTVVNIGSAYALAVLLTFLLQLIHTRRYRQGILDMNRILDRHSAGEAGLQIEGPLAAPELRELGTNINRMLPRVDDLMEDLRNIGAHLAHELRNPLLKIRIGVDSFLSGQNSTSRQEFSQRINREIDQANAQIEAVMELFRLRAGETVALDQTVRLGEALVDLVYEKEEALESRGRRLRLDVDETITVTGNPHLLGLLLENLLQNAVKYAEDGGEISVLLAQDGPGFRMRIETAGRLPDGVDLTGRFKQAEGHKGKGGAGLGLSLVKAIAGRHGFKFALTQVEGPIVRAEVIGGEDGL